MSLYGDLPPPTHSAPNVDKEETQQSAMETQSTSSKSKSALPVGWTPGTLRFMPTIQRKPVIQAKPKLTPKVPVTSPNPPAVSTSPNQNIAPTSSNLISVVSTPPPIAVSTDSEPIATPSSTSISSPKQSLGSEDVNDYKSFVNNQRIQRSNFEKGKKQGKGAKRQAPLLMDDDYDPTRPNDYEEYKEYEKRRKEIAYHEEHSRRRSMSPEPRQRTPPRSFPPPPSLYSESQSSAVETFVQETPRPRTPPAKIDLDITGEEAFLRRARLSNQTAQKSPEPKPTSGPSTGEDFAHRILAKYGWQEGQGLGKDEQGINEPLKVQKTDYRSGIIVNTSTNILAKSTPAQVKSVPIPSNVEVPSRVILLTNMVGPGEVDDTLQEETADECNEKYGAVERCLIFEVPHGKLPDDQAVRIFVKFETQAAAIKAKKDLNGRFFGGRSVTAKFFDESRFDKYDLAPSPAEIQKAKQKESSN